MRAARIRLGELLLALDRTMVTLQQAPRGLDLPVASVALVDADDVRLGIAPSAGNADLFFLLGVPAEAAVRWLAAQPRPPVAVFVKEPSPDLVRHAVARGAAVVAVDPHARWERLYRLANQFFDHRGDRDDPPLPGGTDLFSLAQSIADRARGMVSIEDAQSHVLAYSASSEEADELRRLSILGRAGPPEHLAWIGQWGIFDALRSGADVVRVAERPELGLRPRMAVGIHLPSRTRRTPTFAGTIWLQQGSAPFADDAEEVLRGGAVLAARVLDRMAATPSTHTVRTRELLGLADSGDIDVGAIARDLGVDPDSRAALIGFGAAPSDVIALSATAFRADAQVASTTDRVYVLLPKIGAPTSVTSWVRGVVGVLQREAGLTSRAVIAAPLPGLTAAAAARVEIDRVFDSAARHPGAIGQITSLADARTTVLLDEIVAHVATQPSLVDPRVRTLRERDPLLAETLQAYLDGFGDISAVAGRLHVHPNTIRYRVRRIETLLGTSLDDPDDRLVLALGLRATEATQPVKAPSTNSSNRSSASSPSSSIPRSGPRSAR
ncbi:PucR family transcriptional regulator [Mycolicibacterium litorale]|uniref:Transcriptional regulator n=1 Tax=Mycolicibacterium litorale TaxID=758802 RepID=A0AAD1MSW4_9MYCO|nr:helix-turn-helix domain-containing protein [Mycolicibacterium litorale]MCV7418772.1 helix-turn-helix domain-containing protein [Mycolicibacterium litorale]TDY05826.1 DNA-binding PucR family transcriptional regulator [Mycolicibacterium litorale]BBY14667.1 transcriptional regulator [Mycolicibacterium litorale]